MLTTSVCWLYIWWMNIGYQLHPSSSDMWPTLMMSWEAHKRWCSSAGWWKERREPVGEKVLIRKTTTMEMKMLGIAWLRRAVASWTLRTWSMLAPLISKTLGDGDDDSDAKEAQTRHGFCFQVQQKSQSGTHSALFDWGVQEARGSQCSYPSQPARSITSTRHTRTNIPIIPTRPTTFTIPKKSTSPTKHSTNSVMSQKTVRSKYINTELFSLHTLAKSSQNHLAWFLLTLSYRPNSIWHIRSNIQWKWWRTNKVHSNL